MNKSLPPTPEGVVGLVRDYLESADLQQANCEGMAETLNAPYATIQNRLRQGGTRWEELKKQERIRRLELVMEREGKVKGADAAEFCGFWEANSFYRFFQDATGQTFTQWRMDRAWS